MGLTNVLGQLYGFKTLVTESLSLFSYKMRKMIHGTHEILKKNIFVSLYIHTLCVIYICTFVTMISRLCWAFNTFYI